MTKLSESLMAKIKNKCFTVDLDPEDTEGHFEVVARLKDVEKFLSTAITRAEEEVRREVEEKYRKQFEADKLIG